MSSNRPDQYNQAIDKALDELGKTKICSFLMT